MFKKITAWCVVMCAGLVHAEGIIDIKPSVGANITYDDNVFRFSTPTQAKQAFGSTATSDVIKRVDVGLEADVRLSRQILRMSTNLSETRYDRFDLLDNTAKSYLAAWDWHIGEDFFGTLSTSKNESIAGFTEINIPVNNLRTIERQSASLNWRFHPDWSAYISREQSKTRNELTIFDALNRDDVISETGMRYGTALGTQLRLSYRMVDSKYPNRVGGAASLFGKQNLQSSLTLDAAWMPTQKTRISARVSRVKIDYEDNPQRDFSGISQRWDIGHTLTSKVTLNASAYREVSPIDDTLSTYVEVTGASFNPSWAITNKVFLNGGVGYEDREYLGSSGIINSGFLIAANDRSDSSKTINLGLVYTPTLKSVLQLQYQTVNRESSLMNQGYRFNSISFIGKYDF